MKILTISDIRWDSNLKKIDNTTVNYFELKDLKKKEYNCIKKYFSIISDENPDLVLFAGDITGDGSCGHGYQNAMKILLTLLEVKKIQSFFISGNHDEERYYKEVIDFSKNLQFCKDISNQTAEFMGLKILGITFGKSENKTEFIEFIKQNNQKIDIVLAHAELRRRMWLFDLNTDFIITGHFDRKLTSIEGKIFISLDNDYNDISYCVLDFNDTSNIHIHYFIKKEDETIQFTEKFKRLRLNKRDNYYNYSKKNGYFKKKSFLTEERELLPLDEILKGCKSSTERHYAIEEYYAQQGSCMKFLRGLDLKKGFERTRKIKNEKLLLSENEFQDMINLKIDSFYNFSKTMIIDYAGINYILKNKDVINL